MRKYFPIVQVHNFYQREEGKEMEDQKEQRREGERESERDRVVETERQRIYFFSNQFN